MISRRGKRRERCGYIMDAALRCILSETFNFDAKKNLIICCREKLRNFHFFFFFSSEARLFAEIADTLFSYTW